ncbi:MAG: DUF4234 domain-containing protein [Lachnospiraceae bacterium]|nr:DUF4234 domain-containing protein [Lachnospiraceae bacterium]
MNVLTKRDLALYIILSIVTCGIFMFVWMAFVVNDVNEMTGHPNDMSGGLVVLLSIITCGIFWFIWSYMLGDKIDNYKFEKYGLPKSNNGVVYLILSIFGLSIVTLALAQNEINQEVDRISNNNGTIDM